MKNILINYAERRYYESQKENCKSGLEVGGFDIAHPYNSSDIDKDFYSKNSHILDTDFIFQGYPRGAGYWLWKPYIIHKALLECNNDDVILYADSGSTFIGSFKDYYFEICRSDERGLILFGFEGCAHKNSAWTKRDCFVYMDCDDPKSASGCQLTASFQLVRRTEFTLHFYSEMLKFSQDSRILTDAPNTCGLPNYPDFKDHRHDQSILSLLRDKYSVNYADGRSTSKYQCPSQWGDICREYDPPGFKTLIQHHRNAR